MAMTATKTTSPATNSMLKVLLVGPVRGEFDAFLPRVANMYKQAHFNYAFAAGDFFAADLAENVENGNDGSIPDPKSAVSTQDLLAGKHSFIFPIYISAPPIGLPAEVRRLIDARRNSGVDISGKASNAPVMIVENLFYLGHSGVWEAPSGLRVAYLGGRFNAALYEETTIDSVSASHYTKSQVDAILRDASENRVDLLLTHDIPQYMSDDVDDSLASPALNALSHELRPRYHACVAPAAFIERAYEVPPSFCRDSDLGAKAVPGAVHTRFLALAPVVNNKKHRWYYAYHTVPLAQNTIELLASAAAGIKWTPYPFPKSMTDAVASDQAAAAAASGAAAITKDNNLVSANKNSEQESAAIKSKRPLPDAPNNVQGAKRSRAEYVCRLCNIPGHHIRDCSLATTRNSDTGNPTKSGSTSNTVNNCWFCFDSPTIARNLIVAVGSHVYAAVAKGPLVPYHMLLSPTAHMPTFYGSQLAPSSDELVTKRRDEIAAFEQRLIEHVQQSEPMTLISFEISRTGARLHAHVQCLAVPTAKLANIASIVSDVAARHELAIEMRDTPLPLSRRGKCNFFEMKITTSNDGPHQYFFCEIPRRSDSAPTFPLQLGREIVGQAIGQVERSLDWKLCIDDALESRYALELRSAFASLSTQPLPASPAPEVVDAPANNDSIDSAVSEEATAA